MCRIRSVLLGLLTAGVIAGCTASAVTRQNAAVETNRGLVGAWIVTASRPGGVGKNLLTFSSDGTFFEVEIHIPYSVARMVPGSVWAIKSSMPPISRFDAIKAESGSEAPRPAYISLLGLETIVICRITRLEPPRRVYKETAFR